MLCKVTEPDTQRPQCGASDRKCPEHENPETEGGFVGPGGGGEWKIESQQLKYRV